MMFRGRRIGMDDFEQMFLGSLAVGVILGLMIAVIT